MDEIIDKIHKLSIDYTQKTDVKYLKQLGQYFTVEPIILDKLLDDYHPDPERTIKVLEPSCGTGCIIGHCLNHFLGNVKWDIHGVDIDANILDTTKNVFKDVNNVTISQANFLEHKFHKTFDLIIGNPPYFEVPAGKIDKEQFGGVMCGRTNIYTLFIYKSIKLLNEGGELRFVVPKTMLSGKYFSKLREFIHQECDIIDIVKFDKNNMFFKALQTVIILKLRKHREPLSSTVLANTTVESAHRGPAASSTTKHTIRFNNNIYFVSDSSKLGLSENDTTIRELGCIVKTGSTIWNIHKKNLQYEPELGKTLPLVMASNINDGKLDIYTGTCTKPTEKKQHMIMTDANKNLIETGPFILTNRIVGMNPPKLKSVLIEQSTSYFVENHVNIIKGPLDALKKIKQSLDLNSTTQFIQDVIGNTQVSQNELQNIIPIK